MLNILGNQAVTIRFDAYDRIWFVTPKNELKIMEWNPEGGEKIYHSKMLGDPSTIPISGKMLRYNQDRLKMGFKRSDRDIVIFDLKKENLDDDQEATLFQNITPPGSIIMDFRITDDAIVAACSNFEVVIINMVTKEVLNVIKTEGIVNSISITPDNKYLACSIYSDLNIYEFIQGYQLHYLHKKLINLHRGKPESANPT